MPLLDASLNGCVENGGILISAEHGQAFDDIDGQLPKAERVLVRETERPGVFGLEAVQHVVPRVRTGDKRNRPVVVVEEGARLQSLGFAVVGPRRHPVTREEPCGGSGGVDVSTPAPRVLLGPLNVMTGTRIRRRQISGRYEVLAPSYQP